MGSRELALRSSQFGLEEHLRRPRLNGGRPSSPRILTRQNSAIHPIIEAIIKKFRPFDTEFTMTIIAMTREMGTLGKEVAREFARRRNHSVVHHELVESADERRHPRDESEVYRFLEGSKEELDRWRNNRSHGGYLTAEEVFEIAIEGDTLIRGWGACRLLKSVPNVLSVRVCAPMEFRIEQIMQRLGVDERAARREIKRSDAAHSRTFLRFFEEDWSDPVNYDLVLNTAHLTPKVCADILVDTVASPSFEEGEETRRDLADRLLEARIATALRKAPELERSGRHIQILVEASEVRLYGVVKDGMSKQSAEKIARAQSGVRSVRNEIVRAHGFDS
jgi:cytidylate kinase